MVACVFVVLVACGGKGGAKATPTAAVEMTASVVVSATSAVATATATIPPSPTVVPATVAPATVIATSTPVPGPAVAVYRGDPSRRVVALTFDAGSDAGYTQEILATLRAEHVRASFSVTGVWAEQHHDLLLAIAADGHLLMNHSYDHASFTGASTGTAALTAAERESELSRTETTVYHISGRTTRPYFRPPYGDIDDSVLRDAGAEGYGTVVMWTVDTLGWNGATADAIVARCLAQAEPGAIYVMHVGSASQDAAALQRVIDGLRAAGYGFVGIDEMVGG
jgi:peptidoglycan/xylan/chitin deacetylase (PgdA/CDA1 family)